MRWDGSRKSTGMIGADRQDTDTGREAPRRMAREGEMREIARKKDSEKGTRL